MKKLTILGSLLCTSLLFAQQQETNLPPGSVVKGKASFYKDLSYKLNNEPNLGQVDQVTLELLKDLTPQNLDEMRTLNPASFEYYSKANLYFLSLSNKVRALFTAEELWYIYQFDQNLKEVLPNIQ